jgi:hypothetical protein
MESIDRSSDNFAIFAHNVCRQFIRKRRFAGGCASVDRNPNRTGMLNRGNHCGKIADDTSSGALWPRIRAIRHVTANTGNHGLGTSDFGTDFDSNGVCKLLFEQLAAGESLTSLRTSEHFTLGRWPASEQERHNEYYNKHDE